MWRSRVPHFTVFKFSVDVYRPYGDVSDWRQRHGQNPLTIGIASNVGEICGEEPSGGFSVAAHLPNGHQTDLT